MTIKEAVAHLTASEQFKEDCRHDAKLRVYLGRLKKQGVKNGAAVELLEKYGYEIVAIKRRK
jgi:hypothetical protein